jgi:soluble lytic murein transglycosylase
MVQRLTALIIFLIFVSATVCLGRDPATSQREVVAALERSDYVDAEAKLKQIQTEAPVEFTANNLDYALARVLQRNKKQGEARQLFEAVVARNSNLSAYALSHLAEMAQAAHQITNERNYLDRLLKTSAGSVPAKQAQRRLGENYLEGNDFVFGIALLRPLSGTSTVSGREVLAKIGQAYADANDNANARAIFNQLVVAGKDDSVLIAAQGLDQLDKKSGRSLTEYDHLNRARIYMFNRRFPEAREHWIALTEQFPSSKYKPEALFQGGRTYYLESNFDEAIKLYERAHTEFPQSEEGEQGYYHVGHAHQKAGRFLDAVRRYDEFLKAYPESQWLGGAYLNAIDSLRSAGRLPEALVWVKRAVANPSLQRDVASTTAVFDEAKIYLTQADYSDALDTFTKLQSRNLSTQAPGSTNREEVTFMRGYCLEQMGRIQDAVAIYLAIPDERDNFYGHRATLRLQALANDSERGSALQKRGIQAATDAEASLRAGSVAAAKEKANLALRLSDDEKIRKRMLDVLRRCYEQLPAYRGPFNYRVTPFGREFGQPETGQSHNALARELVFLGMYDEGSTELSLSNSAVSENVPEREAGSDGPGYKMRAVNYIPSGQADTESAAPLAGLSSYSLSVYLNRGDHADKAILFGEPAVKALPKDYRFELLPRDFAELSYPAPYRASLRRSASERNIDPRLVLALARQESRFQPQAKSVAAARGLMQFIPDTSNKIAAELGYAVFDQDQLYNPDTAFLFGAQYVKDLNTLFPDNPYAIAASYNGGEDNVQRWRDRGKSDDIDRLIIEISFSQTKDYIYKVMSNYWAYQAIYSQDLH